MQKIVLEFNSDRDTFLAYMPFLKKGGVFVRTSQEYTLGEDIRLDVSLPDSLESSVVIGQICWITPQGVQNGTPCGVGVAFIKDDDNLKSQIEKTIGRFLNSADPTYTM